MMFYDAFSQYFKWSSFSASSWARGKFNPLSKSFILSFEITFTRWEINKTSSKFTHNKAPIMLQNHRSLYVKANIRIKFQNLVKYSQFWTIFRYKLSQNRERQICRHGLQKIQKKGSIYGKLISKDFPELMQVFFKSHQYKQTFLFCFCCCCYSDLPNL